MILAQIKYFIHQMYS